MPDTLYNSTKRMEITPHISGTVRTPSLTQVRNVSLNGLPHIQNIGVVSYQLQVKFVIHDSRDDLLLSSWQDGDLIKVVDDNQTHQGYILDLTLSPEYAEGYHEGEILLQEETFL